MTIAERKKKYNEEYRKNLKIKYEQIGRDLFIEIADPKLTPEQYLEIGYKISAKYQEGIKDGWDKCALAEHGYDANNEN